MLPGDRVGVLGRGRLPALGGRLLNESLHAVEYRFGVVLGFDDCFPIFLVDFHFGPGSDAETLANLLRKDDPTFRIHRRHSPTYGGKMYNRFVTDAVMGDRMSPYDRLPRQGLTQTLAALGRGLEDVRQ